MPQNLAVAETNQTALLEAEDIMRTMAEVRAEGNDFLPTQRARLEVEDRFFAMQLVGYEASARRSLGDIGVAAVKGVLVANRMIDHVVDRGVLDYSTVKAYRQHNLPIAAGCERGQMEWQPRMTATEKAIELSRRVFRGDVSDALDIIQTPPMHVACVRSLMLSLMDTRSVLRTTVPRGR